MSDNQKFYGGEGHLFPSTPCDDATVVAGALSSSSSSLSVEGLQRGPVAFLHYEGFWVMAPKIIQKSNFNLHIFVLLMQAKLLSSTVLFNGFAHVCKIKHKACNETKLLCLKLLYSCSRVPVFLNFISAVSRWPYTSQSWHSSYPVTRHIRPKSLTLWAGVTLTVTRLFKSGKSY